MKGLVMVRSIGIGLAIVVVSATLSLAQDKPAGDKPAGEKPAVEKLGGEKPGGEKRDEQPVALKRVVLFSSSVGFFELGGQIEGNQQIEFDFKTDDLNDLLKSLVVQDYDGGLISSVNYGSPEPLDHTLRTFAIDLTDAPTLAEIFLQLRGQKVRVDAPERITGVIVSVEIRKSLAAGGQSVELEYLNLRTEDGLQSVQVNEIKRTQFVDPKIDGDFQKALELLSSSRARDTRTVKLDFRGEGKRNVSIGYIQEAPVWKTSYRLVVSDKMPSFLQGWAIVENTTPHDWKDVQLSLISGRPISFIMDLYQPLFMSRPLVTPEQHASLHPRIYDQDLASRQREVEAAAKASGHGLGGMAGGMGGMGGGMGGMGGGGGFFGGGGGGPRPFITTVVPDVGKDIDPTKGVESAAKSEEVGELFRYAVETPVTLPRNESAMLPIVNEPIEATRLSIYNPEAHAKHPLNGLQFKNTTKLHLLQGPITIFDGGEYAGDARIADIAPNSKRIITYALDLETEVSAKPESLGREMVSMSIFEGGIHIRHKETRRKEYVVKNESTKDKVVWIEKPLDEAWTVTEPTPEETTRSLHRFAINVAAAKTGTLLVIEEREVPEKLVFADVEPKQVELYLTLDKVSPQVRETLNAGKKIRTSQWVARGKLEQAEREYRDFRANQSIALQNVNLLRGNKEAARDGEVEKASKQLLLKWLAKLETLDKEIDAKSEEIAKLKVADAAAEEALRKFYREALAK
jgi:uncharacterized membrane protein YgcG